MSPAGRRLWGRVAAATRQVRRDGVLAAAGVAAALAPITLVVAWLLGGTAFWVAPSPVPLALLGGSAAAAVCAAVWAVRRWVAPVDDGVVAAAAERWGGLPGGSVRGLLELSRSVPAGTSPALYLRAEAELAHRLAHATPRDLAGALGDAARRRRTQALAAFGALGVGAAALGFLSPDRSRAGWGPLLHPVAHLSPAAMAPLVVEPGDVELPRGAHLDVAVQAPGRTEVTLRWRAEGDVPRQRRLTVTAGRATARVAGVDAPLAYWVVAPDGASSDTFHVTPVDPLLFSDLVVDVVYPAYLGRPAERFEDEVPPLTIPAGTELRVRGRATRPLVEAALRRADGASRVAFQVVADRFNGRWTPRSSGAYEWRLVDRTGASPGETPPPLELTVVPDSAPRVDITFPGPDTLLGPEMRQAVVADARDDHGLRSAVLVSWRVSALGDREPPVEQRLTLEGDPDRAIVRAILDANQRRMLPGDELHYFVRVVDASPMRQAGVSATHVLRLPGMEELRRQADAQTEAAVEDAESLARSARQLEETTRGLARQSARSARAGASGRTGRAGGSGDRPGEAEGLGYEEREQARQVLERQDAMLERVERLRERTEALRRAMEAAGLHDPALQQRLAELRQLYDQILTPELRRKLEELRASLDGADPEAARRALEQLAKQQEELSRQIDRSLELLRRAALEQQMNAAARDARELAAQQQALAEALKRESAPSPERAEQQRDLEAQADSLRRRMAELQRQLAQQGEERTAEQAAGAGEELDAAQQAMRRAADQARRRQGGQAGASGEEAAQRLERAAESLESAREAMAEAWRDEVQQTVQQAANDALELAQRQAELLQEMQQAQQGGRAGPPQPLQGRPAQQQAGGQTSNPQGQQAGQQGQQGPMGQQGQQSPPAAQAGQQGQAGTQGQSGEQGQQGESGGAGERGERGGQAGRGGERSGGRRGGGSDLQGIRSEQAALQQGLQALGRNLAEAGERSAMVDRDVGAALGRAMLSMQQTLEALEGRDGRQGMPVEEARRTVEALNRLALELLENGEQIEQAQSGTGLQEALEQLAELAKQQGALNGQANSLLPLELGASAMAEQMQRMAREQADVAKKLGGLNDMAGGEEDVLGRLDELAREAEEIARELSGGRLDADLLARQERLFHRLLDAGRTLEREEYTNQRVAERPGAVGTSSGAPLGAELLDAGPRYPAPDPAVLRSLPAAYRRLILEYFDRLNRAAAAAAGERDPER